MEPINAIYIQYCLLDFAFSLKWLWIIVIFLIYKIINKGLTIIETNVNIKKEQLIKDTEYDEQKIIAHIDYIINEALDRYVLLNIVPKNIYYINSKIEKDIINYLINTIPDRLSSALLSKLSLIYSNDYVPKFLGEHIYMVITNYVLEFNLNQEMIRNEIPNNKVNNSEERKENTVDILSDL